MVKLEKRNIVVNLIKNELPKEMNDDYFLRSISGVFVKNSNYDSICHHLTKIFKTFNYVMPDSDWPKKIYDLARRVVPPVEELVKIIENRINGKYGHKWNDMYQYLNMDKRSLQSLRENGVKIRLSPSQIESIRGIAIESNGECPILDKIKNEKIFSINGFNDSKASLTIHDTFDHYWVYDKLENNGILSKYSNFLNSIGDPQNTDIFKREGEIIASASYNYRYFQSSEKIAKKLFSKDQILNFLLKNEIENDNINRAIITMESLDNASEEMQCLLFVINSMTIELMEQRRKHGFIRLRSQEASSLGILPVMDPEYLSLIVDVVHFLFLNKNDADLAILKINCLVEEYLINVGLENYPEELNIKTQNIEKCEIEKLKLPKSRIDWVRNNLGFTSNKALLCE